MAMLESTTTNKQTFIFGSLDGLLLRLSPSGAVGHSDTDR